MTTLEWILVAVAFGFLVLTIGYGLFRYASRTGSPEEKRQLRLAARAEREHPKTDPQ